MTDVNEERLSSVTKALRVLQKFSFQNPIWRIGELSEDLNFSKSTVSRLVQTLVEENFLTENEDGPGYKIGSSVFSLGGNYMHSSELYHQVSPVLNQLVLETGESAHIAVRNNLRVMYLHKQISPYHAELKTQAGGTNPAHATSSGKVLMAYANQEAVDAILQDKLEAYTEYTLTNPIHFRKELDKIRQQGYALTANEYNLGYYSLAAPVFNQEKEMVCAITIVGPLSRFSEEKKDPFIKAIKKASTEASERLGYKG